MKKTITGIITCIDSQMLSYSISFECVVKHSIFDFNITYHSLMFKSIIEGTIREIVSKCKMKYFVKNVRDEYNMERDKWINIPKTEEAQRRIRDLITDKLIEEARKYKFNLKKFNWTPCQQCHSLYAALS